MYCPICESEYIDGIRVCKDCDEALVAELEAGPDLSEPLKNKLIFLKRYSSVVNGQLDRSLLESSGIKCFLLNTNSSRMLARVGDLFDCLLMVEEEKYDEAVELLASGSAEAEKKE